MKLIIEGPDLSGKTYAIDRIAKHFNSGFTLKNNFKPINKISSATIYKQYWHILNLIKKEPFVILDRFFPSQAVYSYLRGVDEFISREINGLDLYCKENDFIYIYLDTPMNILLERYDQDGDEHIKKEELKTLKERYDQFFEITIMKKIKLNTLEKDWLKKLEVKLNEYK